MVKATAHIFLTAVIMSSVATRRGGPPLGPWTSTTSSTSSRAVQLKELFICIFFFLFFRYFFNKRKYSAPVSMATLKMALMLLFSILMKSTNGSSSSSRNGVTVLCVLQFNSANWIRKNNRTRKVNCSLLCRFVSHSAALRKNTSPYKLELSIHNLLLSVASLVLLNDLNWMTPFTSCSGPINN